MNKDVMAKKKKKLNVSIFAEVFHINTLVNPCNNSMDRHESYKIFTAPLRKNLTDLTNSHLATPPSQALNKRLISHQIHYFNKI